MTNTDSLCNKKQYSSMMDYKGKIMIFSLEQMY